MQALVWFSHQATTLACHYLPSLPESPKDKTDMSPLLNISQHIYQVGLWEHVKVRIQENDFSVLHRCLRAGIGGRGEGGGGVINEGIL